MGGSIATIAVVFDFDDTLVPDSTTQLLQHYGIDTKRFWKTDVKKLVRAGYDPALAYLNLMLRNIGAGKSLGQLTASDLVKFGSTLDSKFYPGLPH